MSATSNAIRRDGAPFIVKSGSNEFAADIVRGLRSSPKHISCRWLYDQRGSKLFEDITALDDYYPTRIETSILHNHARDISSFIGPNAAIIEYGSGAAKKTELLLSALSSPALYIAIDIAQEFLADSLRRLNTLFPDLRKIGIAADFTRDFPLTEEIPHLRRITFFPGSTLGNLSLSDATSLLKRMRNQVGDDGASIIGVDLVKPLGPLLRAYNDAAGVTAVFNRNLLTRINRELDSNFDVSSFNHEARWNATENAIEMHLVSLRPQTVRVAGTSIAFSTGESIHTESSRKYTEEQFAVLARSSGWKMSKFWTDPAAWFGVFGLTPAEEIA